MTARNRDGVMERWSEGGTILLHRYFPSVAPSLHPSFGTFCYTWVSPRRRLPTIRSLRPVPDTFDPYREALVMETNTIWPAEFDDLPGSEKAKLDQQLHADPAKCSQLEYVRTHTGFCRQVTVTGADVQRLSP